MSPALADLDKVMAVIRSCRTPEHMTCALRMLKGFHRTYRHDANRPWMFQLALAEARKVAFENKFYKSLDGLV